MRIGLFAADNVGSEIVKFFREQHEPLACLVLDSRDRKNLNSEMKRNSGIKDDKIFYSDSIYEEEILEKLSQLELDLIILAWWPYILKKSLLALARLGIMNFHPSLLPYNRGKHYNFWTVVEDTPFGVTLQWVEEGIDSGDIAFQSVIGKSWEDTGESLYCKAQEEMIHLFKENFAAIKMGTIPRVPQDLGIGSFHKSCEIEKASKIELDKYYKARDLLNILRARTFPPHPGAWFVDKGAKYEIQVKIGKVHNNNKDE